MAPTSHTMVAFIKRKEGMSLEDFYKYWEDVHGPLVKPWAEKHGLTYKQVSLCPCSVAARLLWSPSSSLRSDSGTDNTDPHRLQRPDRRRLAVPLQIRRLRHL